MRIHCAHEPLGLLIGEIEDVFDMTGTGRGVRFQIIVSTGKQKTYSRFLRSSGSCSGTTESSPAHSIVSRRFSILATSLPSEILGVPWIVDLNGTIISSLSLGDSWKA